jgi:hypothetical protein
MRDCAALQTVDRYFSLIYTLLIVKDVTKLKPMVKVNN